MGAVFRGLKTGRDGLASLVGRFGGDFKERFQEKVKGTREATFFDNIITNRHLVAHSGEANVTFGELVEFYEEGHKVLDIFSEVIQ